jgi:hypothetical protein
MRIVVADNDMRHWILLGARPRHYSALPACALVSIVPLCRCLRVCAVSGVKVFVTNANHASIRELYSGLGRFYILSRRSLIAGSAGARGNSTELGIAMGFSEDFTVPAAGAFGSPFEWFDLALVVPRGVDHCACAVAVAFRELRSFLPATRHAWLFGLAAQRRAHVSGICDPLEQGSR